MMSVSYRYCTRLRRWYRYNSMFILTVFLLILVCANLLKFKLSSRQIPAWLIEFNDVENPSARISGVESAALSLSVRVDQLVSEQLQLVQTSFSAAASSCLIHRRTPVKWIVFVGHSRIRQVFETLSDRLALRYMTRGEVVSGHPVPFRDLIVPPQLRHLKLSNSSCLEVSARPTLRRSAHKAWCSHITTDPTGSLRLEYRWRHNTFRFVSLLQDFSQACATHAICPDFIFLAQGLHFVLEDDFSVTQRIFRGFMFNLMPQLTSLIDHGVQPVWMLEHASNTRSRTDKNRDPMNDRLSGVNTLLMELLALQEPRVRLWSSHLSPVLAFLAKECAPASLKRLYSYYICEGELFHVDNNTRAVLVDQLMHYLCPADEHVLSQTLR